MNEALIEPLKYYTEQARQQHHKNANDYFDKLVDISGIDLDEHRKTIAQYKEQQEKISNLDRQISKYNTYRILLIVAAVIGVIITIAGFDGNYWLSLVGIPMIIAAIVVIVKKINPPLKDFNGVLEAETAVANELHTVAESQMQCLNALFNDTDTLELIKTTIPEFTFDYNFSTKRRKELIDKYQFTDMIDEDCSMLDMLSGTFMDNPFLYERYVIHSIGSERYEGSLEISWVEYYTDGNGNRVSQRRYQTLYASVEKPKPFYVTKTMLYYGCQGAPDLSFSRNSKNTKNKSEGAIARMAKAGERKMQRQARKSVKEGGNFTEMANAEFDGLFGAFDRDNEVQFRMMFTPLAQTNIVKLIKSKDGYGDDFDFCKLNRLNVICTDHHQTWDMNTGAERYYSYDIDLARDQFLSYNNEYFKSLFFDFAPLFSIPLYHQPPVQSLEPMETKYDNGDTHYTEYEYEVLANALSDELIAHEDSVTDTIIKTKGIRSENGFDTVSITAYSYTAVQRVDYVTVLGGDQNYHNVPVPWIEYVPVEKTTTMSVKELNMSSLELRSKYGGNEEMSEYSERASYCHGLFAYLHTEDGEASVIERKLSKILN